MTTFVFANVANSTLAAPLSSGATSLTLTTGSGALFPAPTSGQQFVLVLTDAATGELNEVVYCTARTGDVCTVVRAQEGTTALTWAPGDFAKNSLTAGTAAAFVQGTQGTMAAQDATAVAITGGAISGVELASIRGNTAARPNPPPFLGCQYFDTDLSQPIWCNEITPSIIWVNAAGVSV